MDVLEDILGSLRLSGGVVVDGEFSGDFCVSAEFTPGHFEPFYAVPDKLISYHYVRSGTLIVEVEGRRHGQGHRHGRRQRRRQGRHPRHAVTCTVMCAATPSWGRLLKAMVMQAIVKPITRTTCSRLL